MSARGPEAIQHVSHGKPTIHVAQPDGWYTTGPDGPACSLQVHYVAQYTYWLLSHVHEHVGSGATRMSLVALTCSHRV